MRRIITLLVVTMLAFCLIEGIRLAAGQGWSWIWAAAFACVLFMQLLAYRSEKRSVDQS